MLTEPFKAASPVYSVAVEPTMRRVDSYDVTLVLVVPGPEARKRNTGCVKNWLLENADAIAYEVGEAIKGRLQEG